MDEVAALLPERLGCNDDQSQPEDVGGDRQRNGRGRHEQPLPRRLEHDKAIDRRHRDDGREAFDTTARRRDFVGIGPVRIQQAGAILDDVDVEHDVTEESCDVGGEEPQRKRDVLGRVAQWHAQGEEEKREETGAKETRPPQQSHQGINPAEECHEGDPRLLREVAEHVQAQGTDQHREGGPPDPFGRRDQFISFPPEEAEDHHREQPHVRLLRVEEPGKPDFRRQHPVRHPPRQDPVHPAE
jgi:hypothetical protein